MKSELMRETLAIKKIEKKTKIQITANTLFHKCYPVIKLKRNIFTIVV